MIVTGECAACFKSRKEHGVVKTGMECCHFFQKSGPATRAQFVRLWPMGGSQENDRNEEISESGVMAVTGLK